MRKPAPALFPARSNIGVLTLPLFLLTACATPPLSGTGSASLTGTGWELVQIQSASGTVRPGDPSKYQLILLPDGDLAMKLDCNRGAGKWSYAPEANNSGGFTLSTVAMTRAACAAGSLDSRIASDAARVRRYALDGNRLLLTLDDNASVYVWEQIQQ
jgi:para-nitrobenzyl esterase